MMADRLSEPFVMYGTRDAIAAGLVHVEQQVTTLERAVIENPSLVFDLAKTLIESVCKSVLQERSIGFADGENLPKLFRAVCNTLPFLPAAASSSDGARESLTRTLNGLGTAVQGICELRNQCGFASHGSSGPRPALETVQALLAAEAADAIVGFLYRVHRQDRAPPQSVKSLYEENSAFNESIDDTHGIIQIFDAMFRPSEVLFEMEPETYRVYLAEFVQAEESAGSSDLNTQGETA